LRTPFYTLIICSFSSGNTPLSRSPATSMECTPQTGGYEGSGYFFPGNQTMKLT